MLPRYHIILGAILSAGIWFFVPGINKYYLALVFFSSFLIDFDHYAASVLKTGRVGLGESFRYHRDMLKREKEENRKGVRRKGDFHLFHTVEFHIFIGLLGIIWISFFYIFIGMIFHSLVDLTSLVYSDRFYRREYFLFNWLGDKSRRN